MIATEIVARYEAGAGMRSLMAEYHIGQDALRHILVTMGVTIRPSGPDSKAWERPAQVKEEILAHYQAGDSLVTLMAKYHIGQDTLRRLLTGMGATIRPMGARVHQVSRETQQRAREARRASEGRCIRCEILLRFDPGQDGFCGECSEEVSHAVVPAATLHCSDSDLPDQTSHRARFQRQGLEEVVS